MPQMKYFDETSQTWKPLAPTQTEFDTFKTTTNGVLAQTETKINKTKQYSTFSSSKRVALISIIDDDINKIAYTRLYPLLKSKGAVAGVAAITGIIDGLGMTTAQLKEVEDNGWEIMGHTKDHNPNLSIYPIDADLDYQLGEGCKTVLENKGFTVDGFVYPQSVQDLRIRRFTKMHYDYAFADTGINTGEYVDSMRIKRIGLGSFTEGNPTINGNAEKNTLAYYKACVDYAVANNGWLVFMTHCASESAGMDEAQWTIIGQLLDYINSINVPIVTPNKGYKAFGNNVFIGDLESKYFIANENGIFTSRKSGVPTIKNITYNSKLSTDGISTYDHETITVMQCTSSFAGANSFPPYTGGTLLTYYFHFGPGNEVYNWQEYQSNNGVTHKRFPLTTTTWGTWIQTGWSAVNLKSNYDYAVDSTINMYTAAQLIGAYPNNKVTTFYVNGAGSTGFPGSGIVTTYRLGGNGWARQEFRKYASNEVWSRYVSEVDGSWTPFVKISAV